MYLHEQYTQEYLLLSKVQAVVEAIAPIDPVPLSNDTEPSSPRKNAMILRKIYL